MILRCECGRGWRSLRALGACLRACVLVSLSLGVMEAEKKRPMVFDEHIEFKSFPCADPREVNDWVYNREREHAVDIVVAQICRSTSSWEDMKPCHDAKEHSLRGRG